MSLNVCFIDAGNCPIVDFDILTPDAVDALERSWALFAMGKFNIEDVQQITITKEQGNE